MKIVYKYNNIDIKTYGVSVSKGKGFMGRPERKVPKKYEYPDENGYIPDLTNVKYKERVITLECFIVANSAIDLVSKFNAFSKAMMQSELVPFVITINTTQVFAGNVFVSNISDLNKTLKDGQNVGTFILSIIEPNPTIS